MDNAVLTTLARYNRAVNAELSRLVNENESLVTRGNTTYYGSVLDSLVHIANADVAWLRRTWFEPQPEVRDVKERLKEAGAGPEVTIADWTRLRGEIDGDIEAFCDSLDEQRLLETVRYENNKGDVFLQPRWQCLLHMFNHQTHHRGMIAQVLDEEKIVNDYSNLIRYLKEINESR